MSSPSTVVRREVPAVIARRARLKPWLADQIGTALARMMAAGLFVTTALLPKNGRSHVRARALNRLADGLQTVVIGGTSLLLQERALITGRPLEGLEPETFRWLAEFPIDGETIWDIGANIGLYSLWAAQRYPKSKVLAFEPHAPTFAALSLHIIVNDLGSRLIPLPVALADERLSLTPFRWFDTVPVCSGSQLDLIEAPPMWAGARAEAVHVLSASIDCLVDEFGLPPPAHLKIDVDGIEPLILRGAKQTLRSVRSVLIEFEKDRVVHHRGGETALITPLLEAGLVEDRSLGEGATGRNRLFVRQSER